MIPSTNAMWHKKIVLIAWEDSEIFQKKKFVGALITKIMRFAYSNGGRGFRSKIKFRLARKNARDSIFGPRKKPHLNIFKWQRIYTEMYRFTTEIMMEGEAYTREVLTLEYSRAAALCGIANSSCNPVCVTSSYVVLY